MPGLVALIVVGAGYDVYAKLRRKDTISAAVWSLREHPGGNVLWLAAVSVGLVHFRRRK